MSTAHWKKLVFGLALLCVVVFLDHRKFHRKYFAAPTVSPVMVDTTQHALSLTSQSIPLKKEIYYKP